MSEPDGAPTTYTSGHHAYAVVRELGKGGQGRTLLVVVAAVGICTANQALGSGSVFQYFIPGWEARIFRTGRTYKFGAKGY